MCNANSFTTLAGGAMSPAAAAPPVRPDVTDYVKSLHPSHSTPGTSVSPAEALALLQAGNALHAREDLNGLLLDRIGPQITAARRQVAQAGQAPLATVLTCADSRVSPEIMFGAGIGTIFVVRNAGGVVAADTLACLEFGCLKLQTPLLIVMGHEGCAAVSCTVAAVCEGAQESSGEAEHHGHASLPGYMQDIIHRISPAAEQAVAASRAEDSPQAVVQDAVVRNANLSLQHITDSSPGIAALLRDQPGRGFRALAAMYSQTHGSVEFFTDR